MAATDWPQLTSSRTVTQALIHERWRRAESNMTLGCSAARSRFDAAAWSTPLKALFKALAKVLRGSAEAQKRHHLVALSLLGVTLSSLFPETAFFLSTAQDGKQSEANAA